MKKHLLNGFFKAIYSSLLGLALSSLAQAQPVVTSFSPGVGPVGTTVTIVGANFNPTASQNVVFFGAVPVAVQSVMGSTTLTATVPYGTDYQYISVTNLATGLLGYSAIPFGVTYTPLGNNQFKTKVELTSDAGTARARFVTIADMNNDGKPDLIVGNSNNTISVFVNQITSTTGMAVFGLATNFGTANGSVSASLAIGDLDGDGLLDIAAVNSGSSVVTIYHNITHVIGGTPNFAPSTSSATPATPVAVRMADIDGDGLLDIIVVSRLASSNVAVLRNLGNILGTLTFASAQLYSAGVNPSSLAIGDMDQDGKVDIAVANGTSNSVSLFHNTSTAPGAITLGAPSTLTTNINPASLVLVDLDGDGLLDLATANTTSDNVSVFQNTSSSGVISFNPKVDVGIPAGSGLSAIYMGDTDGDGKVDLATANSSNNTVSALHNVSTLGSLSFTVKADVSNASLSSPYRVRLGDLNGDGKPDLVAASSGSTTNNIAVFLQKIGQSLAITSASALGANGSLSVTVSRSVSSAIGGDISYTLTSIGSGSATVDASGNLTGVYGGAVLLTVTAVGSSDYASASDSQLITISSDIQTLTINLANTLLVDGTLTATVTTTATGGRGGAITFAVSAGSGSATVDSSTGLITGVSIGTVTLIATTLGDSAYSGASDSQLITIEKTTPTLSITSAAVLLSDGSLSITVVSTATYGRGGAFTFAVSAGSGSATIDPNTGFLTMKAPGTVVVTVTSLGDTNYYAATTSQAIIAIPIVILTFVPPSGSIGDAIVITGENLDPNPANNVVFFGATRATVVSITGSTEMTVIVPFGTSFQYITVTNLTTHFTAYAARPFVVTYASNGLFDFAAKVDFPIGTATTFTKLSLGDLDGDGKVDVVVPNTTNNTVTVLRNTSPIGSFSFQTTLTLPTGASPRVVTMGDLDGDGQSDLAVSNYDDDNIYLFRNNTAEVGSLSFTSPFILATGSGPYALVVQDFNRDGKPGIAVANYNSGSVSMYRNTSSVGHISFGTKYDIVTGTRPYSVAACDFNLDGFPDLAVANYGDNTVSVIQNNSLSLGNFDFTLVANMATGNGPAELATGDLDGDQKSDLGVALSLDGNVSVFRNISTPSTVNFTLEQSLNLGGSEAIAMGDMNGDGKVDLVVVNSANNNVSVLHNSSVLGSIIFSGERDYATDTNPFSLAIGDLDLDGKLDIATVNENTFSVLRNVDLSPAPIANTFSPKSGAVGDLVTISGENFNATPSNNVVFFGAVQAPVVSVEGSTTLTVRVPLGASYQHFSVTNLGTHLNSYSTEPFAVTYPTPAGSLNHFASKIDFPINSNNNFSVIASRDLDKDGKTDIAVLDLSAREVILYKNTSSVGSLSFTDLLHLAVGAGPRSVAIGDLDGDGFLDLAVAGYSDNSIHLFHNNAAIGSLSYTPVPTILATGANPNGIQVYDFDLDGKPDLATVNSAGNSVSIFRNVSTLGNLGFSPKKDIVVGSTPFGFAIGDLDSNGKPDIVTADFDSNTISVLENRSSLGTIDFTLVSSLAIAGNPSAVAIGDLDLDGKPDLAVTTYSAGTVAMFRNISAPAAIDFSPLQSTVIGSSNGVTISDVNGDGNADLVVALYTDNKVSVFQNNSALGTLSLLPKVDYDTDRHPFSIVINDFDLDGRPDIATVNDASFSVLRNILIPHAPVITSFSPENGTIGSTVTITGNYFDPTSANNLVFFGATQAVVVSASSTTLVVTTPYGANYQYFSVTNLSANLTGYSARPFGVIYAPAGNNTFRPKVELTSGGGANT